MFISLVYATLYFSGFVNFAVFTASTAGALNGVFWAGIFVQLIKFYSVNVYILSYTCI